MFTVYTTNRFINAYTTYEKACEVALAWATYFHEKTAIIFNNKVVKRFRAR